MDINYAIKSIQELNDEICELLNKLDELSHVKEEIHILEESIKDKLAINYNLLSTLKTYVQRTTSGEE